MPPNGVFHKAAEAQRLAAAIEAFAPREMANTNSHAQTPSRQANVRHMFWGPQHIADVEDAGGEGGAGRMAMDGMHKLTRA